MINRTLIRLKVVQLMFAYYMDAGKTELTAEKELFRSLNDAYNLYHANLNLIIAIRNYARRRVEEREEINRAAHIEETVSHRFINNKFVKVLEDNVALRRYTEEHNINWNDEIPYIKSVYEKIISSDFYTEYMQKDIVTYEEDKELWRLIYKRIIIKDEEMEEVLEEKSLYWNDDRTVVDTFVLKTIKRLTRDGGEDQPLEPDYKDDEDREYAIELFRNAIRHGDEYREMISKNLQNWEFSRLAYMDIVIMQTAIAEFMNFPKIPISVTINEYVEIAKWYSTERSSGYVNGVLDTVAKSLKDTFKLKS